jgi:two-component system sensor histidine kinase/response regulator
MMDQPVILYIEDDPASLRMVESMLTRSGYQVLAAECGLDGIDLARKCNPDLILTDINLPDITGYELATTLRNELRFRETPIVALTAQSARDTHQAIAIAAGITGYLTKPIDIDQLLTQLTYYLEGGHDEIDSERLSDAQVKYTRDVVGHLEERIRELEARNAELRKLDKLKQNFIQITAHELRTPLTLVIGYSRLLKDHQQLRALAAQDNQIHTLVDGLGDAVGRMHIIIEEIMITSRILAGQMNPSISFNDLGKLVKNGVHHFDNALRERAITVHVLPDEWPKRLVGDSEMLRIAITNLLSNAIKYTPDGGDIYLQCTVSGDQVEFSVQDTGIGIDLDAQEKIFDKFHALRDFELHSSSKTAFLGGGLGLGLAVCKGVVEAHHGTIRVESPGHDPTTCPGSRFIVTLPLGTPMNIDPNTQASPKA